MNRFSVTTIVFFLFSTSIPADDTAVDASPISRSNFTTGIDGHEPVDNLMELSGGIERIYFFTELSGLSGQVITHSWEYRGTTMAEVHFKVDGPRWRVWSSKILTPEQQGTWTVTVLNPAGEVLDEKYLDYNPGDPARELVSGY